MNVRCEININEHTRRILLVAKAEERHEHIALRLAAAILFFHKEPALEIGPAHPAVTDYGFFPDLLAINEAGGVGVWIECGNTALNKLTKVARRLEPGARLVLLRETPEEGKRLRGVLNDEIPRADEIEVLAWPKGEFKRWAAAVQETNTVIGDSTESSLNLVLNEELFAIDLLGF
jgi:uncharacterized protein YaeQ